MHFTAEAHGWSTMVQSVLTAAVKVTEILCPAMSQELVQDATDKVRRAVPARKALHDEA